MWLFVVVSGAMWHLVPSEEGMYLREKQGTPLHMSVLLTNYVYIGCGLHLFYAAHADHIVNESSAVLKCCKE